LAYEPIPFEGFGAGLNLSAKADAVGPTEAVDLLNVTLTEREAIQSRDGYAALTSSALTNRPASLEPFYTSSGTKQLIAGCGTRLEAVNTSGAVVASATGLSEGVWDFARFGAPGSEYVYAGQGNDTIRRWDGASWTAPANMPAAGALAVLSVEQGNRLVVGRFNTTTGGHNIGRHSSSYSNDDGNKITSRWRSGWSDLGIAAVKTIRETKAWGSGVVRLGVAHDFQNATGWLDEIDMDEAANGTTFGGSETLGGSGVFGDVTGELNPVLRRRAVRGTVFSTYLENSRLDQDWSLHRLEHNLRDVRIPSIKEAIPT
jgi:hypothetical protein